MSQPPKPSDKRPVDRRTWLARFGQLIFAIILVIFLLKKVDIDFLSRSISNINWFWLGGSFAFYVASFFPQAALFRVLMDSPVQYRPLLSLTALRYFLGSMVPGAGDISFVLIAKRRLGIDLAGGAASVLLVRFWVWVSTVLWAIPAALFVNSEWLYWGTAILFLFTLILGAIIFLLQRDIGWLERFSCPFGLGRYWNELLRWVRRYQKAQKASLGPLSKLIPTSVLSLSSLTCGLLCRWMLYRSLGIPLSFWQATSISIALTIASNIPVHVLGGLGTYSASIYLFLVMFGVASQEEAASYGVAYQVVIYVFLFLVSFLAWVNLSVMSSPAPQEED